MKQNHIPKKNTMVPDNMVKMHYSSEIVKPNTTCQQILYHADTPHALACIKINSNNVPFL